MSANDAASFLAAREFLLRLVLLCILLLILVAARDHARCKQDGSKSDGFPRHRNSSG